MKDTQTKQIKVRSAIGLLLDEFESIDLSLRQFFLPAGWDATAGSSSPRSHQQYARRGAWLPGDVVDIC
jgi:hypothetical protein